MTVQRTLTALFCIVCILTFVTAASAAETKTSKDGAKSSTPAKVVSATKATPSKEKISKKKLVPFTYGYARRETAKTGKPLLVFVGAQWCGACVQMKNNVLPDLKKSKLMKKVSFAVVDFDENQKLSRKLTGGGPIPQTILFCKDKKGWHSHKLIGGQNLATVESLIKESLAHAPEKVAGQETKTR